MAVTGQFVADFASFQAAVRQAEVSLRGFEAGAGQAERALDRMVDSFTGRQVISEATLMSEAISRIGSPARLTSSELQRVGAVAEEAAEKLRRVGEDVPPKIQQLADASRRARGETDGLRTSFQAFDGVLASLGLNLGPQIRGIEDIASASGKSASQLGKLATAGLAVGAGVAGWGFGRLIADFAGTDKAIGDATAKFLGWGDVAAQESAAGADAFARASTSIGFQVRDMSTALVINQGALKAWQDAAKVANDAIARMDAPQKSAAALAKFHGELATLKTAGLIESLRDDIKSQAFSLGELAERYRVSVDALQLFSREEQRAIDVVHRANEQHLKDTAAALEKAQAARKAAVEHRRALDAEAEGAVLATQKAHELGIAFDEAQSQAKKKTEEATKALEEQKKAADAVARSMGNSITYDLSTPEGMAEFRRLNPMASVTAPQGYFDTHTIADAVRDGLINFYAGYNSQPGSRGGPVALPTLGGGGATLTGPSDVNVGIHVSGILDARTIDELTTKVGAAIAIRTGMKVGI